MRDHDHHYNAPDWTDGMGDWPVGAFSVCTTKAYQACFGSSKAKALKPDASQRENMSMPLESINVLPTMSHSLKMQPQGSNGVPYSSAGSEHHQIPGSFHLYLTHMAHKLAAAGSEIWKICAVA